MMDRSYTGRCAMRISSALKTLKQFMPEIMQEISRRSTRQRLAGVFLAVLALSGSTAVHSAEALPLGFDGVNSAPLPVPVEAEAAHQDLVSPEKQEIWLDEAVFTDISPLTVPEIGIALPADQEH